MNIRIIVAGLLLVSNVYAMDVEPVITHNVTVISNPTQGQCKSSWNGQVAAGQQTTYSGAGDQTGITSPGILSCSHCAVDQNSGGCVCKTCYSNYSS
jgi:hypothetical protein